MFLSFAKELIDYALVFALFGVILIARPAFLFGHHSPHSSPDIISIDDGGVVVADPEEKGTPRERLIAVGYVSSPLWPFIAAYSWSAL